MHWRRVESERIRLQIWPDDDTAVMYDARSGDTHLLGPLAVALLDLIAESPSSSVPALVASIAAAAPGEETERLTATVASELATLSTLGLIAQG